MILRPISQCPCTHALVWLALLLTWYPCILYHPHPRRRHVHFPSKYNTHINVYILQTADHDRVLHVAPSGLASPSPSARICTEQNSSMISSRPLSLGPGLRFIRYRCTPQPRMRAHGNVYTCTIFGPRLSGQVSSVSPTSFLLPQIYTHWDTATFCPALNTSVNCGLWLSWLQFSIAPSTRCGGSLL